MIRVLSCIAAFLEHAHAITATCILPSPISTASSALPGAPQCVALLPSDLLRRLQERFAREHNIFPSLDEPLLPDDPLRINQEEGPLGDPVFGQRGIAGQAVVLLSHLRIRKV